MKMKFDNSKHIITGVVCLADTPIYRYNERMGEYYVVFTKETIEKMVFFPSLIVYDRILSMAGEDTCIITCRMGNSSLQRCFYEKGRNLKCKQKRTSQ